MNLKAMVMGVIVAFVVFYAVVSPDHAASIVHAAWAAIVNVAHGIGHFLDSLSK